MAGHELLEAALEYAGRGWPVFPLQPGGKVPLIRGGGGFKDATTNTTTIRAWWRKYPNANIGLRTGVVFDAIDVDPRHGGDADKYRKLYPDAYRVRTGGGGLHVYCKPSGGGGGNIEGHAVEFKADGGYVVAAPSIHTSGKRYEVENAGELAPPIANDREQRVRNDGDAGNGTKTARGIRVEATIRTRNALVADRIERGSQFNAIRVAAMHLASCGASNAEIRAELERMAATRLAAPGADTSKKITEVIRSARRKYPATSKRKWLRNLWRFVETRAEWRGRGGATDRTILVGILREAIQRDALAFSMPIRSIPSWAHFGSHTTASKSRRRLARDGWLKLICHAGRGKVSSSHNYATGKPAPIDLAPTSTGGAYAVTVPKKLLQSFQIFCSLPATAGEQAKELEGITSLFHDAARWSGGVGPNTYTVFRALLRRSWRNAGEIAAAVSLTPRTVRAALKRLQREGIAANQGHQWFLAVTREKAFSILDVIAARVVTRNAGVPGCPGEVQVVRVGALKQRQTVAETVRRDRAAYQARAMKAAGKPYGVVPDVSQVRRSPRPFETDARDRPRGRLLTLPTRKEPTIEIETKTKIAARFKRKRKAAGGKTG